MIMIEAQIGIEEKARLFEVLREEQRLLKLQLADMIYEHRANLNNPFFDYEDWQKRFEELADPFIDISNTLENWPPIRAFDPVTKKRKLYGIRKVYKDGKLLEIGYSELR